MIAKAAHSARRRRSDHDGNLSAASGEDAANLCVGYFSLALVQQHRCSLTPLLFRQIRSLGPVRIPTMLFRFGCTRMRREREKSSRAARRQLVSRQGTPSTHITRSQHNDIFNIFNSNCSSAQWNAAIGLSNWAPQTGVRGLSHAARPL